MSPLRRHLHLVPLTAAAALALSLVAVSPASAEVTVRFTWTDPTGLTDAQLRGHSRPGDDLPEIERQLRSGLEKALATRLPEGAVLDVEMIDLDLAGELFAVTSPGLEHTRIVNDFRAPAARFRWQLSGAGETRTGEAALRDSAFLMWPRFATDDALVYEQRMLAKWARRTFAP